MNPLEPVNILLVDDNYQNLVALSAILRKPEYNLVTATSGPEALRLLLRQEFAMILLDVMMPGMDGFETATFIKGREKTRYIPIIFVTAVARDLRDIYQGYAVGGVDYIQKPLDPQVVRAKVAVFVDLFRSKEEVKRQADVIQKSERAKFLEREQEQRYRAEMAEKRYYDLINWVDHAVLWEYDAIHRRFAFVSRRSAEILGFSADEWLHDAEFFFSRINKDDLPAVRRLFGDGIEHGKDGRVEHRFINKGGEEIWVHSGVNPRKDMLGNVTLLWGLTLDITPFKLAEENQRFLVQASAILNSSLDYHTSLEKVSKLAVPEFADWCTVDITEGEAPMRIIAAHERPELKQRAQEIQKKYSPLGSIKSPILEAIATRESILFRSISDSDLVKFAQNPEHLQLMKDAGFKSLMIAPLLARGKCFGAITFATCDPKRRYSKNDVMFAEELARHAAQAIDNSRLYAEAQRAIQLRENVLGIVSHDLKSPLTAISMNLQLLLRGKADPKAQAEKSLRSIEVMSNMIHDLLDLGKIEAGEMKFDMKPCSVSKLLAGVMEILQPIAQAKSISLKSELPAEELEVICDKDRLVQVFSNLIGNAIKFTPEGGSVRVGTKADEERVAFWVTDTGHGIAAEDLPHVFEPYWQGPTGKKKKEGTGLGLYISKRIVEAHEGRIWIESKQGAGTRVQLALPRKLAQPVFPKKAG